MNIYKNIVLDKMLRKYNLTLNESIENLPDEIDLILSEKVFRNEYWVRLKKHFIPDKSYNYLEKSYYEDENNHFHVDWYIPQKSIKHKLSLAIYTLKKLAEKFEKDNVLWVRFCLSFQTPSMWKKFAIQNDLHEDWNKYYVSDRLSFYTLREWEEVLSIENINDNDNAILIIDV